MPELFVDLAERLATPVAVLRQVPFQPIFGMREDDLIAHTFEQYVKTGEADWPLLLPMVKSVVRAMDATQVYATDSWDLSIEEFTVTGASKRGWTTWLTAAVDPRVTALAPMVIDMLNMRAADRAPEGGLGIALHAARRTTRGAICRRNSPAMPVARCVRSSIRTAIARASCSRS